MVLELFIEIDLSDSTIDDIQQMELDGVISNNEVDREIGRRIRNDWIDRTEPCDIADALKTQTISRSIA